MRFCGVRWPKVSAVPNCIPKVNCSLEAWLARAVNRSSLKAIQSGVKPPHSKEKRISRRLTQKNKDRKNMLGACSSAPKARNVTAWANGPGMGYLNTSAESAKSKESETKDMPQSLSSILIHHLQHKTSRAFYFAPSALQMI